MYQTTALKNGVRVLTIDLPGRDSISLGFWIKVGGRFEPAKISGTSHFIEHLVFKGTKDYSMRAIKENIEGKGGMLNAFTGEESTCYFTKILPKHLNQVFSVLSDLVCDPLLRKTDMDKERMVILEEIKMYKDIPSSHIQDVMGEMLWENQPLGHNIAGSEKTVSRLSAKELKDFHRHFYKPANILITAAGNVDHAKIVSLTKKRTKHLPLSETSKFESAISLQSGPKLRFIEKDTEQCNLVVGLHGLPRNHQDRFKLGLLHVVLGANMSSRLFNEVREKRGLAYSISSSVHSFLDAGSFLVSAGTDPKKAPLAIRVSMKEMKKMAMKNVGADELRRAKDYYIGQLFLMLEDTLDHMIWAGEKYLHLGDFIKQDEIRRQIERVTADDIRAVAKSIFDSDHLNLALIGPVGKKAQNEIKRYFSFEKC